SEERAELRENAVERPVDGAKRRLERARTRGNRLLQHRVNVDTVLGKVLDRVVGVDLLEDVVEVCGRLRPIPSRAANDLQSRSDIGETLGAGQPFRTRQPRNRRQILLHILELKPAL